MKKLSFIVGAMSVAFLLASCCGGSKDEKSCCKKDEKKECQKPCCEGLSEEQKQVCAQFQAQWEKFDSLTVDVQEGLIARKKGFIDAKRAEAKAKIAKCDSIWAEYDKLTTTAEQKAFIDANACCKKKCDKAEGEKKCCKKEEQK
ncbi:MAG: hypothetical protein LBN27_10590 [Prevotellaceae bacterium]|jgi:hypothetical protein|nr:hypothetical protein [Prevotellaceae bacterium]